MEDHFEVNLLSPEDDSGIEILGVDSPMEDTETLGVEGVSLSGEDIFMVDLGEGDLSGMDTIDPAMDEPLDII